MNAETIRRLLEKVRSQDLDIEAAIQQLKDLPYEDLGFARVDHHRALRTGVSEIVYCEGKTPPQVAEIMARLSARHGRVLGTRATAEMAEMVRARVPGAVYHEMARMIIVENEPAVPDASVHPPVAVCAAGTSDLPVAEEAARTIEFLGGQAERLWDVGVAGLHRLIEHRDLLGRAGVVIAVAGMEGALPGVVAGLTGGPVIAVPTSVGYGASFAGLSALLTMINSCAPGVMVVNIDNGFGAGYAAQMIVSQIRIADDSA